MICETLKIEQTTMRHSTILLFFCLAVVPGYGQITPVTPLVPDSVYIMAEMLVEIRVYEEDTLYGFVPNHGTSFQDGAPRMIQWMREPFGAIQYLVFPRHRQPCPVFIPNHMPSFDTAHGGCITFDYLYQVKRSNTLESGYIVLRMSVFSRSNLQNERELVRNDFLEHGKLVIGSDTLKLNHSVNCGDHEQASAVWACWPKDDMVLHPNNIVQISISSRPPPPPAPYSPTELKMWQHRASNGSVVPGAVWLSWRIPVNGAGPDEQLRIEREHGIYYEYKVLRDGDNEWETIFLEDTKEGVVDDLGPIAYQRRKYLVTGLDRNGEYSFCVRAVNASGTSAQVCNLDVITPVSVEPNELPATTSMSHNYPNPFNLSTDILYDISVAGYVRLAVYDMTGRTVTTLVDRLQPAGWHEIRFNAHGLPTGTYVYRLTVGEETLTRMMTLFR